MIKYIHFSVHTGIVEPVTQYHEVPSEVAFSFDTTGSMREVLDQVISAHRHSSLFNGAELQLIKLIWHSLIRIT